MYHKQLFARIFSSALLTALVLVVVLGAVVGSYYTLLRFTALESDVAQLRAELASTTRLLAASIEETHSSLSGELSTEKQNFSTLRETLVNFQEEVEDITGTVSTLEKLSRTDPELLQKYSRVFFLNEHYMPERLVEIPDEYEYSEAESNLIHAQVWPKLKRLLDEAKADGVELYISSAYRSFAEQDVLKGAYSVTYGAGTANQFSADQGYSEHQLGTTVDFITTGLGGKLPGFDKTEAYTWLLENAYRFGFILSYPKDNGYYIFEPWHWRFVGVALAGALHEEGKYFYDLEQREIDEYLVSIFD
jgi:LAS superfamily LD-carboxypeptidase LdcB